jgi:hypothetical protein
VEFENLPSILLFRTEQQNGMLDTALLTRGRTDSSLRSDRWKAAASPWMRIPNSKGSNPACPAPLPPSQQLTR